MLMNTFLSIKRLYVFSLLLVGCVFSLYGEEHGYRHNIFKTPNVAKNVNAELCSPQQTFTYYLDIETFGASFIEIPTSNVFYPTTTIGSSYLAGRAPLFDENDQEVGTCSASFLSIQTTEDIFTNISNYISVDNGLIVSWFTPSTPLNLEVDSVIFSMVTECMVTASTKIGVNPFYGQTFNLIVSSDNGRIYFQFTRTGTIF